MRALTALVITSIALGGCIIYEERYTKTDGGCVGCTDPGGPGQPGAEQPQLTDDLALTIREGLPGETVLTNLVAVSGGALDPTDVVAVRFDRDVLVSDLEVRDTDTVLLLQVVDGSAPGPVEVFVRMNNGREWVLVEPFTILEGSTDTGQPAATGDTGAPSTTDATADTATGPTDATTDPTGDDTGITGTTDTGTSDTGADTGEPQGTGLVDLDGTGDTGAP